MEESRFRKKVTWFNFISCLLVIWHHAGNAELFLGEASAGHPLFVFEYVTMPKLSRFCVPSFIMLTGYLFYRGFEMGQLREKWARRVKSLLIPYLFWNTVYYAGYVAASRIGALRSVINRPELTVTLSGFLEAVLHFSFNPVFWFMYQLILLVALAPLLYLILKRVRTGAAFFGFLLLLVYQGRQLLWLNPDAVFYYSAAAFAALHGRRIAEAPWNRRRAGVGILLIALGIVLGHVYYAGGQVAAIVLCQLLVPAGAWAAVPEGFLGQVRPFMTCTFFIYAFHFVPVRLINKLCAAAYPGNVWAAGVLFGIMPGVAVAVCYQAVRFLRKFAPRVWSVANGGR